jgi:hypothetical protein
MIYRSILTVPWIELGGTVTITCAKTGYNATIEFLTKPFYGGKKNRLTAEIFAPSEKKSFLSISGEWNGLMEAKWADGVSTIKNTCIIISTPSAVWIFFPSFLTHQTFVLNGSMFSVPQL